MGHRLHRVVFTAVDQRFDDRPVLTVGLFAPPAELVEEGGLAGQRVPDLFDHPAEDRVLRGLGDRDVEDRVHGDPRRGVGLPLHPVQQMGQVVEVLRGTAHRRVTGDRDLDVAAHLEQVARRVVAEGGVLDRVGDHEGALARTGHGQAHHLQGPQRLAEHRPADLQAAAQLRLGGSLSPMAYSPRSMALRRWVSTASMALTRRGTDPPVWLSDRFTG